MSDGSETSIIERKIDAALEKQAENRKKTLRELAKDFRYVIAIGGALGLTGAGGSFGIGPLRDYLNAPVITRMEKLERGQERIKRVLSAFPEAKVISDKLKAQDSSMGELFPDCNCTDSAKSKQSAAIPEKGSRFTMYQQRRTP